MHLEVNCPSLKELVNEIEILGGQAVDQNSQNIVLNQLEMTEYHDWI